MARIDRVRFDRPPTMFWSGSFAARTGEFLSLLWVICLISAFGNLSDVQAEEGRVIKQFNYRQSVSGVAVSDTNAPYSFYTSISRFSSFSAGTLMLPASSPYLPNPITIVASNQMVGPYYVYEVPFASMSDLNTDFPDGTYTFNVSGYGSNFTPQVSFSSSVPYPASVPTLTNPNWSDDGKLILDPVYPTISWSGCSGKWELDLWTTSGAGAAGGSSCPSSRVWTGLAPNTTYQATLSAFNTSSSVTVTNASGSALTFIAMYGQVVHFSIITTGFTAYCSYQVENYPPDWTFNENGGSGLIAVAASNSCCWVVRTTDSWIRIGNFGQNSSGCGSGTVVYTVSSTTSCQLPRTGTITVDGQAFSITQVSSNPPCSVSISPMNQTIDSAGGAFTIAISTTSSCCWVVQNPNNWISVSSSSGTGSRNITCSVQANFTGSTRTGMLVIATQTLAVVQPASPSPPPSNLLILQARYGAIGISNNVLSIIQANVVGNTVNMLVNNSTMGGDPTPGHVKTLYVLYQNYNGLFQTNVTENGALQIPSPSSQQLPMDYTQWTTSKFTSVELLNSNISGQLADPDGDGVVNLMEFALGMDPNAPAQTGLPQASVITTNGDQFLSLSYSPDQYATNLTYTVEISSDLINWYSGSSYTLQVTPVGQIPVVVRDLSPISSNPERFMRLRISSP